LQLLAAKFGQLGRSDTARTANNQAPVASCKNGPRKSAAAIGPIPFPYPQSVTATESGKAWKI